MNDEEAYAGEAEPTVYQKDKTYDIKYEDISDDGCDIKHQDLKIYKLDALCKEWHLKMKFYQESGLNLLIYGVGSKRDFLNVYVHEHIRMSKRNCVVVNGFHSGTNLKTLFKELITFVFEFTNQGN